MNNNPSGSATVTASIYDPQVEFLEIGVSVNGAKAWKVYGPDLNGAYGGLQGTGGLEATVPDSGGAATGVLNDYFGNGVATISSGTVTWNSAHVGAYGPLPGSVAQPLTSITQLASAVSWRGHVIDPTGFYNLGARYYEPTSGRFLSADPMGQAASMSLYDFCNGDPVNSFDPDGRCPDGGGGGGNNGNGLLSYNNLNPTFFADKNFDFASGLSNTPFLTNWGQNAAAPNVPWAPSTEPISPLVKAVSEPTSQP